MSSTDSSTNSSAAPSATSQRRFVDKVVIVTGSSAGIGREAALEFAQEGASVVVHGQNEARLKETEAAIMALGVPPTRLLAVLGSMEDPATAERIVEQTLAKFGRIDVLINNAGAATKPGCTDMTSLELLDFIYAVNYRSVVQLSLLALPHLAKTRGNVVQVSSVAAYRATSNLSYYGSMKSALDSWTRSNAKPFGEKGVRINTLNPGPIETMIFEKAAGSAEAAKAIRPLMDTLVAEQTVLGRWGTVAEMASVLKFLASSEASYVTGAALVADGGMLVMQPDLPDLWKQPQQQKKE